MRTPGRLGTTGGAGSRRLTSANSIAHARGTVREESTIAATPAEPAATPTEPAEPVRPVESVEPVRPVEPVESAEPVRPVEPVESAEPPEPVESAAPAWHQWSVGDRVVVRYRIPRTRPTDPGHTDVLGDLVACGPEGVRVRTRSGEVFVPADVIALGKLVPPPPPRRRPRGPEAQGHEQQR